jgi:hypothetical protein
MIGSRPEIDKDFYFTIGTNAFAIGYSSLDRAFSLSRRTSATADSWTWVITTSIPDDSMKLNAKQWVEWISKTLVSFTAALKKFLADIGSPPASDVPNLVGEAMMMWLIKNRLKADSAGNLTIDSTGIN